ncbi:hypothetical protein HED60_04330 [Planctomycetales bacterium ZRK34]|nr:hypothetical protein HED60_04330 [Planctomycetales bacterium ZRK34]
MGNVWKRLLASGVLFTLSSAAAVAVPSIDFGVMDGLALDQPRVLFSLEDPANPGVIVGPDEFFNTAALDTGADSVLLSSFAYFDFDTLGSDPNRYELEHRTDGSVVQYEQVGVAGSELFDLTIPYNLAYVGPQGGATVQLDAVRVTGSPTSELSDLAGIVGMPAMVGRVVTWDLTPMSSFDLISGTFTQTRPAETGHSYHINLDRLATEASGQIEPDDPLPVLADLPLVPNVITGYNSEASSGAYLLDTGATTTLITSETALSIGIDPETDAIDFLPVGGIGGEATLPVVHIDTITLPTAEGVNMVFHDIDAAVLDVEGLEVAGILGFNAFTTGYLAALGSSDTGVFHNVIVDFTNPDQWVMRLDVNPDDDIVNDPAITGDANQDGSVDIADLTRLSQNYGLQNYAEWLGGDFNHDGTVDIADLVLLSQHYGESTLAPTFALNTPEPTTALLVLTLAALPHRPRRR